MCFTFYDYVKLYNLCNGHPIYLDISSPLVLETPMDIEEYATVETLEKTWNPI